MSLKDKLIFIFKWNIQKKGIEIYVTRELIKKFSMDNLKKISTLITSIPTNVKLDDNSYGNIEVV